MKHTNCIGVYIRIVSAYTYELYRRIHTNCIGVYIEAQIIDTLSNDMRDMYESSKRIHGIRSLHNAIKNSHICLNCKQYLLVLDTNKQKPKFVCDAYTITFCIKCNNVFDLCECKNNDAIV